MRRIMITVVSLFVVVLLGVTVGVSSVSAASAWWHLSSGSRPTNLGLGGEGQVVVAAANLGDADVNGKAAPVQIVDRLPVGVRAVTVEGEAGEAENGRSDGPVECVLMTSHEVQCTFGGTFNSEGKMVSKILPPYDQIDVRIGVVVESEPVPGEANVVSVSGGEAQSASISRPLKVSEEATPFGVEDYGLTPEEEGGASATRAGSHPFQVTGALTLNQIAGGLAGSNPFANPVALAKDLNGELPPGLIGNPTPIPRCTLKQFLTTVAVEGRELHADECSPQTAVGVAMITVEEPTNIHLSTLTAPIFNLEPAVGEPARFGILLPVTPVVIDTSVRTGGDYGVTLSSTNISQTAAFLAFKLTFWGVPGDPRHDDARGWGCLEASRNEKPVLPCTAPEALHPPPFLSLPTSCTGPLQTSVQADSWAQPHNRLSFPGEPMPAMDGCNRLPFSPEIKVAPDGQAASTPTGLTVDVHVPEGGALNPTGLANSNIRDIAVTLPDGVTLNPAAADGLLACSEGQVGFEGEREPELEPGIHSLIFSPTLSEPLLQGVNFCPDAAKVGTVKITSPLLPAGQSLEGAVYLATPAPEEEAGQNPFKSLVAMYIVAKDPISGTLVKLPGKVTLNQETGRISASFENTPQLAFEDAELHFFGGERAPLATPAHCGTYMTEATFTPWSGNAPVKSSSSFQIVSGPSGAPCPSSLPFAPTLAAGSPNINAGAFSPLDTTISRQDGNQNIQTVQLHMAPGMSGILAGVKLCGEAQANAGTCGPESEIGETIVSVGLGGDPFTVTGGKVYLTEKYGGAPFGLSIVNPADAGPFHLGKVIVRAKIEVDPHTAQLTITTGQIPHIIDGFPLQIKHVNVTINRPGFTFNPTNCNPQTITGIIGSVEGVSSSVSIPFQVTNCAVLKFAPKFTVSTAAKTSKADGASLHVKLSYPSAPQGSQANIAKVKVDLPKQLPSRLTTLQKACTAAQFEANPAGCPSASNIGHAKAITPLIPVPLEGPAYFVSHGGEAFPTLIMVLQGYGVTLDLVGTTFISKAGITSSTFKTVPDAPVGSFELTLPEGKFSALTALGNLCKTKLAMPTAFTAQNGTEIHQNTKITVTNCPKTKNTKTHKRKNQKKTGTNKHKKK